MLFSFYEALDYLVEEVMVSEEIFVEAFLEIDSETVRIMQKLKKADIISAFFHMLHFRSFFILYKTLSIFIK